MSLKIAVTRLSNASAVPFTVVISSSSLENELKTFEFAGTDSIEEETMTHEIKDLKNEEMIIVALSTLSEGQRFVKKVIPVWAKQASKTLYFADPEVIVNLKFGQAIIKSSIVDNISDQVDELFKVLTNAEFPWYLRSSILYDFLKKKCENIDLTPYVRNFVMAIESLNSNIKLSKVPLFDEADGKDLLIKIDELISMLSFRFDSVVDDVRTVLITSLTQLKTAIIDHIKLGVTYTDESVQYIEKLTDSIKEVTYIKLQEYVNIAIGKYPQLSQHILNAVNHILRLHLMVQETKDKVLELANNLQTRLTINVASVSSPQILLTNARPYVHQAVEVATPYVLKAIEVSQPYVEIYIEKARPFIEKKSTQLLEVLESNTYTSPYVNPTIIEAQKVYSNVISYCLEDNQLDLATATMSTARDNVVDSVAVHDAALEMLASQPTVSSYSE